MKKFKIYLSLILFLIIIQSCSVKTQKTALSGLTDEVYFTPSDTRVSLSSKDMREYEQNYQRQPIQNQRNQAGDFTSSYSNRLRYFGSGSNFTYNHFQPVMVPVVTFNPYTGRNMIMYMEQGQMFYGNTFYSPFSPYYGRFGYDNDFWAQMHFWNYSMNNYYYSYNPYYCYNPFFYNQYPYYSNPNNNRPTNYTNVKRNSGTTNSSSSNGNSTNNNQNNNNNSSSGPWYRTNSDGSNSGSSGRPTTSGSSSSGESPKRR